MSRLGRPRVVLAAAIAAAGVTIVSGRRPWLTGRVDDAVLGAGRISGTGTQVVTGLVAIALVLAAAVVAAATAGAVLRRLTLAVAAVAAIGLAVLSGRAVLERDAVLGRIAADASGRTGQVSVSATATIWPYAVLAAAVLAAGVAALGLANARTWRGLGQRYDAPAGSDVAGDRGQRVLDAWDRLDRGEDPTTGSPGRAATGEPSGPARMDETDLPESGQPEPGPPGPPAP